MRQKQPKSIIFEQQSESTAYQSLSVTAKPGVVVYISLFSELRERERGMVVVYLEGNLNLH